VFAEAVRCRSLANQFSVIDSKFSMGKLSEIIAMKDPFKRRYLLNSMQVMMSSSFLTAKIKGLDRLPDRLRNALKLLEAELSSAPTR